PQNTHTYAHAFAASLTAHDVTRRYTPSYLSKTLRARIDGVGDGPWLASVLTLFSHPSERKQREREEEDLARKAAREPMPRALADFHRHPIYALERHLRRHETLLPFARPIGRVSAGAGRGSENVFRRADVVPCRSAGQWLRLGRAIKAGEQAMKRLPPSSSSKHRASFPSFVGKNPTDEEKIEIETESGKPLYTEPQTKPYIPPPIPASGSPIPRNAYGSLDIYTPAMVPLRGYHATHPLTAHAARVLGIDAVPAVTGFAFSKGSFSSGGGNKNKNKNKKAGKPLITGAIIFSAHRDAVDAVITG
ncbi:MAG: hypothetical protein LQ348_007846, partial [Seirophora lacunosa]